MLSQFESNYFIILTTVLVSSLYDVAKIKTSDSVPEGVEIKYLQFWKNFLLFFSTIFINLCGFAKSDLLY